MSTAGNVGGDQAEMEHRRCTLDLRVELQRELARAEVLAFVSDGDPLSDVDCSPLFHIEAALVEVPSDLDLLLCCHSFCHLPSHPKNSNTDNPKVRI